MRDEDNKPKRERVELKDHRKNPNIRPGAAPPTEEDIAKAIDRMKSDRND